MPETMNEILNHPGTLPALIAFLFGVVLATLMMRTRLGALAVVMAEKDKATARTLATYEAAEASLREELSELHRNESAILKRQGELESTLHGQLQKNKEVAQLEKRFADTFRALSADALEASQQQFLHLAKSTFQTEQKQAEGEMKKREQAVEHLVKPVAESLEKMQARIGEIEKAREGAYASIKEQVTLLTDSQQSLHKETHSLVKALRQPTGRGQWGEIQLQRVVEMAGMQEHCDFTTQTTTTTDEGKNLRPDLIVNLPGGQQIVVDSKAPMSAYLDALEAENDTDREAFLVQHARQVATHIRQLSSKNYQAQFQPAPEFVVLFLPSESFFSAALTQDSTLLEQGVDRNVILATPTTLIALLRSVAYGWRQESLAENARHISEAGRELHQRLTKFSTHLAKVGRSLETSVKSYNAAVSSLESRVLPSARKFEDLEAAAPNASLESLDDISSIPRQPHKEDFAGYLPEKEDEEVIEDTAQKAGSAANVFRTALEEKL